MHSQETFPVGTWVIDKELNWNPKIGRVFRVTKHGVVMVHRIDKNGEMDVDGYGSEGALRYLKKVTPTEEEMVLWTMAYLSK